MRKWYVPLTVLGIGGIGALLMSDRGKEMLRRFLRDLHLAPQRLLEWNEAAQVELDRIQATLNQIAETLEPRRQLGH